MQRTIPATLAMALLLGATPVLAADEEPTADTAVTQRAESAALGFAIEFPADWRVSNPEGERVSAITDAEGEPVMETTAVLANGGGGTWCDVDAYLGLEAPLEEHAYAYVSYLQQNESSDAAMVVADEEIPAGPAFRIEIFDPTTGRIRGMYLFDGPAADDGSVNRFLLTCAAREVTEPFWETIAQSAEVFEPATAEDTMTEADPAESDVDAEATPAGDG